MTDTGKERAILVRAQGCCSDGINSRAAPGQECESREADELIAEELASTLVPGPAPKECDVTLPAVKLTQRTND